MRWLLLAVALAGCGGSLPEGPDGPTGWTGLDALDCQPAPGPSSSGGSGRHVVFQVLCTERAAGRCFDGATSFGDVCERLLVRVDNTGYTNALEVGPLQWQARDDGGQDATHPRTSHERVPSDEVLDVTLGFTLADGGPRLASLSYVGFQGEGHAPVPS